MAALLAIAAAATVAVAAGPAPTEKVAWAEQPALATAATAAAGDGASAEVYGDPGLGCFATRITAAARKADPAVLIRGFTAQVTSAGGEVTAEQGDGGARFVLGRYRGVARLAVSESGAELTACMCAKDRYPVEDACASVWR